MALPGGPPLPAPAPEWPGALSGKFSDPITGKPLARRVVPCDVRSGVPTGLAQSGFSRYFSDPDGLVAGVGKRLVPQPGSETYEWRPCKRSLSAPGSGHFEKPEGRRLVDDPPRKVFPVRERRHIVVASSKEEFSDRPSGPTVVYRENGLRAHDQPAREVDISQEMTRKVRHHDLGSQRNGIGCRVLGDKAYRHPEYENGFHKAGNLAVGSGFVRGSFKRTEPRNSTSVQIAAGDGRSVKSYEEKQREQQALEAQAEVEELTRHWEAGILKECPEAKYVEPVDSDDDEAAQQ